MKVKLLFCFLCMTVLVHAQSFSPEFQTAYDKYLKVAAVDKSGPVYEDTTLQKSLDVAKARLSCAKKAKTLLEILASYEAEGGDDRYFWDIWDENTRVSSKGKEIITAVHVRARQSDSIIGSSSVYREAVKKISGEIDITIELDSTGYPEIHTHLRKSLDKYDNQTLALYVLTVSDNIDYIFSPDERKIVCKRFKESQNPYLIETAIYVDDEPVLTDEDE